MLPKTSRIMLILLVIIIASIFLPHFYWMSFSERIRPSYIPYSPVIEDFIIMNYANQKYVDTKGNIYTREQTDELLPLSQYRLLATKGLLPDTIKGKKIEIEEIRLNSINFQIKPLYINPPQISLFPLIESKPERFKLEIPKEFFRFSDRMEFIDCESNEINEELTKSFTESLTSKGFAFPSMRCYGNPTTRKSYDEGYFVFDNKDDLFHIKRIEGKPYCEKVDIPEGMKIKTIFLREYSLKEFYAFVVTENDEIYLILFDNYKFQKIPIENYNSKKDIVRFRADIFYRTIVVYKDNQLNVYVTDRNYEIVDTYEEKWLSNMERTAGVLSTFIFPFELEVNTGDSKYIDFYFSKFNFSSIYLNVVLILTTIFLMRRKKIKLVNGGLDLLIVLCTGIFGFIAVNIFRYED
jgi:uncharacterized protein DUF4857